MNRIRILSDNIINKIAAGEVIERPASVVKELVENSIDAGASKIDIFVRNGGKSEIKIIDNGVGMNSEELLLAVHRHATSKLKIDELENIKTLGFRGEALPSIASISELSIQSSDNVLGHGHELLIHFGKKQRTKPINKSRGTSVTVKNLFFSTPARLKFLKTDEYEALVIKDYVKRISVCNFSIQFCLYINDKKVLSTFVHNNSDLITSLSSRTKEVLGKEFFENSIPINQKKENYSIFGLAGIPTFNHSNTKNQYIFVNQRVITDKSINQIFKVAYKDVIPYNRFPQIIIFIICDLELVDINVHPAKSEVRFKDKTKLNSCLIKIIREALSITKLKVTTQTTQQLSKDFKKEFSNYDLKLKENYENSIEKKRDDNSFQHHLNQIYPLGFAKCQFHKNYIVSQTKKGIIIVDQHAAHERIIYENLKKNFQKNSISRQILLLPIIIDLELTVFQNIKSKICHLEKFGLHIEIFGVSSIVVREVPIVLINSNIKPMVEDVIQELTYLDSTNLLEEQVNKIFSSMACYGSVRLGRELQTDEMNELLRNIENTKSSAQCNHGRPTYIELDLTAIEKLFNRR